MYAFLQAAEKKRWVSDGTRTHNNKIHNLALYQLNYAHHVRVWQDSNLRPTT